MSEFRRIEFDGEYKRQYWQGTQNRIVRYYAYASRGISLLNDFKYYAVFVFGGYWTAELTTVAGMHINSGWILAAGVVGIPCLVFLGRWHLYRAQKPIELVNTHYGSIAGFNSHNMLVRSVEQNDEIIHLLKTVNEKLEKASWR